MKKEFDRKEVPQKVRDLYKETKLFTQKGRAMVCKARERDGKAKVVVKVRLTEEKDYEKRFNREIMLLRLIKNDHVIEHLNSDEDRFYVTPYKKKGDLSSWMVRHWRLVNLATCLDISIQSCEGILDICKMSLEFKDVNQIIALRDHKPENMLVEIKNNKIQIRISDLEYVAPRSGSIGAKGTPKTTAPECFDKDCKITDKADSFSVAVIFVWLFTYPVLKGNWDKFPESDNWDQMPSEIEEALNEVKSKYPDQRTEIDALLNSTIIPALSKDPGKRPPIQEDPSINSIQELQNSFQKLLSILGEHKTKVSKIPLIIYDTYEWIMKPLHVFVTCSVFFVIAAIAAMLYFGNVSISDTWEKAGNLIGGINKPDISDNQSPPSNGNKNSKNKTGKEPINPNKPIEGNTKTDETTISNPKTVKKPTEKTNKLTEGNTNRPTEVEKSWYIAFRDSVEVSIGKEPLKFVSDNPYVFKIPSDVPSINVKGFGMRRRSEGAESVELAKKKLY